MSASSLILNDLHLDDYSNYLMSPGNQIEEARKGGRGNAERLLFHL